MMVSKMGVKFLVRQPEELDVRRLVPVFHDWIRRQAIEGHLLIDVHDYSHIFRGPGILLVGNEGDFSLDLYDSQPGLLYQRKRSPDSVVKNLNRSLQAAFQGLSLLEELEFETGPLRFQTDRFQIWINDRLDAPDEEGTYSRLEDSLKPFLNRMFGDGHWSFTPQRRAREAVRATVRFDRPLNLQSLERLVS